MDELETIEPAAARVCSKEGVVLCLVLGGGMLGLHRYRMGYKNWWLMALTLGGLGFWSFVDLVRVAVDALSMADGRALGRIW